MSQVEVKFFASLREQIGQDTCVVEWVEGGTVLELITALGGQLGAQVEDILKANDILVAVNQTMVEKTQAVSPGDEVAFLPPVTGG